MSIEILIAAVLTLAIFSFLYKENPFYRAAEHILVGVSVGYYLVVLAEETILSKVARPLFHDHRLIVLIPTLLGLMMFFRLWKKKAYLTRIPLALLIGAGAGVSIPAMLWARVLKQVSATILAVNPIAGITIFAVSLSTLIYYFFSREKPQYVFFPLLLISCLMIRLIYGAGVFWASINGIVIFIGVTTTILYFYFSREQEGWFGHLSRVGVYFLMVFFGATFGYTVMSRVTLLIGRMEFLLTDFLGLLG